MNHSAFERATGEMEDGMARICRLYGVSPLAGRLFARLFVATAPQSLESLCEAVGAAKSSVSVALRKLESARVVRRLPPRTDRRDFYEIVSDPWAVFADWSRLYFKPELEMLRETTGGVLSALEGSDRPTAVDAGALRERLDAWRGFGELLGGLIEGAKPTPTPRARRITVEVEGG